MGVGLSGARSRLLRGLPLRLSLSSRAGEPRARPRRDHRDLEIRQRRALDRDLSLHPKAARRAASRRGTRRQSLHVLDRLLHLVRKPDAACLRDDDCRHGQRRTAGPAAGRLSPPRRTDRRAVEPLCLRPFACRDPRRLSRRLSPRRAPSGASRHRRGGCTLPSLSRAQPPSHRLCDRHAAPAFDREPVLSRLHVSGSEFQKHRRRSSARPRRHPLRSNM